MSEYFQNFNHLIEIYIEWIIQNSQTSERFCCPLYFFLNAFMHWLRLDREACIFLIASAELSATLFTSDASSSQVSSSSDLLVGWRRIECDHEQSSLLFRLKRRDILSRSLGGSCPDPPCAVLLGTALPLPLSGGTTSYWGTLVPQFVIHLPWEVGLL